MIRVLHVIGAMDRGGAETLIMNLYREIDREQIQFDFMVHEDRQCDYDSEIETLGGKIYRVPRFNGPNALSYKKAFRDFFREHDEHDVVHGHIGSGAALYLSEAKRADKFAIAHSHNLRFPLSPSEVAFRAASYPTRFVADYFLAASEQAGTDRFGRHFTPGSRGMVLGNGIDLDLYTCDPSSHEASKQKLGFAGHPVVCHVGRLDYQKNHRFLLRAFALLKERVDEAELLLVGRGPLESELRDLAQELGIADSVHFLGVRQDVPEILKASDLFLFPSIVEGLGMAAVEAQAAGLPTLMSDGVAAEAAATPLAEVLPLDAGPERWAQRSEAILADLPPRHDEVTQVRAHGFDIRDSANQLARLYAHGASRSEA